MTTKEAVLHYLQEHTGEPISGEKMALALNKSRTSIWKAIQSLKKEGYAIESSTNKGYTLSQNNDVLSKQQITQELIQQHHPIDWNIQTMESTTSTNDLAKIYVNQNSTTPAIFISEEQTAGRGRLGRTFISPAKSGLYISLCLFPTIALEDLSLITCATAVACVETLEQLTGKSLDIKWVNDLFYQDKKVGGILTEVISDFESQQVQSLIVGMGINLIDSPQSFPEELHSIVGSIFSSKKEYETHSFNRNHFIAKFLEKWAFYYQNLSKRDFISTYKEHSNVIGKFVNVFEGSQTYSAFAKDIDENGHLIIEKEDNSLHSLSYGEISIRTKS
ncbi:biotin--[acetyl-CoA-carboxylase] ligase [Granulicatella elegans]|uniref:biotin--[acetyl-CoA-carboxylase] ligase n=1 Tax=Granulicatella elegans TaxID=137732 RepID=UPI001D133897|nr:biotin--[acetyl-CoA-carboxylase] ligase [Granulicatella elegans]UEA31474.1 biotin--[acetyl-CoA-carboxylase] ligase [Granulicatella elegans]